MRYGSKKSAMLGIFSVVLIAVSVAGRAEEKPLMVGDAVPEFECLDDRGQIWDSRAHVGKKIVVLYFFPSDFAFCCTKQALSYRGLQSCLADWDVELIGVSGDTVAAHRMFKETYELDFSLLADEEGCVARRFGVPLRAGGKASVTDANGKAMVGSDGGAIKVGRAVTASRWTYIVGLDGRIVYRETDVSPVKDSQEVMEFLCNRSSE